jgi:biotin synthase
MTVSRPSLADVQALFELPLLDLVLRAATAHAAHFPKREVQVSTLLSIKTGACPEDCQYCPQSVHYDTGLAVEKLMPLEQVVAAAKAAKANGADRFCMGAAWRSPRDKDVKKLIPMIQAVRDLGLETCLTAGMLTGAQAHTLKDAGLDYYNHNLDSSAEHYAKVISTRTYQDRLDTLAHVHASGMKTCCGGIVGMGETRADRVQFLHTLANLPSPPESVPMNQLVAVPGTPLADLAPLDPFEFVRCIAVARITMPNSMVRLSAGRESMSDELQAMCFLAGANSIFYGEKLLTTGNPEVERDRALLSRLGLAFLETGPATIPAPHSSGLAAKHIECALT